MLRTMLMTRRGVLSNYSFSPSLSYARGVSLLIECINDRIYAFTLTCRFFLAS